MADNYIVSARKYRPDTFASIVGQGAMSSTLRTAVVQGRMAHAYLFCGPRGVGKTTAARVLAKTINCQNLSPEGEACNACESCKAFNEQRSFNIFELDAASNNSVEDIRSLTDQVAIPPAIGRYKVYIIDEVHMLSQAAFNAFLKTLEEPPSYAIFILATTEKHKILPTILSRCQIYDFRRITVLDIAHHLAYVAQSEGIEAEEAALSLIAEKADGGMRDALSMFDRVANFSQGHITYAHALECLNVLDYSYYTRIVSSLIEGRYHELLLIVDELLGKGFDGQVIVGGLASFMRDLLVVQHPGTAHLLEKPESVAMLYQGLAQRTATASLHQAIKLLVACDQQYRTATNKRLLVELTMLNLLTTFSPSGLGEQVSEPVTPRPATAPQPAPSAQPIQPARPAPATQQVQPTPQPANPQPYEQQPQASPRPQQPTSTSQQGVRSSRQALREGLRGRMAHAQTVSAATVEEDVHETQAFDENKMQRAWMTFVEQELESEHVILKNLMRGCIPTLKSPEEAEVAVLKSPTTLDPMTEILPRVQAFMRKWLHNGALTLSILPLSEPKKRIPITNRERFEALAKMYPDVLRLREELGLRIL